MPKVCLINTFFYANKIYDQKWVKIDEDAQLMKTLVSSELLPKIASYSLV